MQTFSEYVIDWWVNYLINHRDDTDDIMLAVMPTKSAYAPARLMVEELAKSGKKDSFAWLMSQDDAGTIYRWFFAPESQLVFDDLPDTETFVTEMLTQAAGWFDHSDGVPSFADEFISDMVNHIQDYDEPLEFFQDLANSGANGYPIAVVIYSDLCKAAYLEHLFSIDEYIGQIMDEYNDPTYGWHKNDERYHHAVTTCYEEFARSIASALYPDEF